MGRLGATALGALLIAGPATADVLGDWTDTTLAVAVAAGQPAFLQSRTMAMVHVAMFEAINSVDARYVPFRVKATASPGTSAEAAAAVAAHDVLAALYPAEAARLDASLDIALARLTDAGVRASSAALGQRVAAGILALRTGDGSDAPNAWTPRTPPGLYIPTSLPLGSAWGKVTPWVLERGDQLQPAPPPALTSAEWARDYNEVKSLGGKGSQVRTAAQTETALFWIPTGPLLFCAAARELMDVPGRALVQNARLLALLSLALADSYIAVFAAKYTYNFWRPITAIRDGDMDQNDATQADPTWLALIDTPMHPEYPCAHCINAGAAGAILEAEFGSGKVRAFRVTSPGSPRTPHSWQRVSDFVDEVSNARVWGGVHFRNSTVVGTAMGRKVGELVWQKVLRPLK
ncbi:MAG TPA: vanadium-dependent haloperoxidase [Myxococcaceae bacterium]|nr:vanadium-dependent haloperoxidase [Myxococcaceae bacterium]